MDIDSVCPLTKMTSQKKKKKKKKKEKKKVKFSIPYWPEILLLNHWAFPKTPLSTNEYSYLLCLS